MGHHHRHHHHPADGSTGNIRVAFFLNLLFTIVEIVGGLLTNSLAILSDALHDLGDSLSLGLAWYFQRLSGKGRDAKFSYGYRRFSLLGAIVNSMVLVVGSVLIISAAVPRLMNPEEAHAPGMMLLALGGIAVNGLAVWRLRRGSSINERVVSLHLLEDVLGWVAVLIGAGIIWLTGWHVVDPILSLGIAAYILFNVYRNLRESLGIILQAVPHDIDIAAIDRELGAVTGVASVHDLHVWSLDGERNVLTVHLVLDEAGQADVQAVKGAVNEAMKARGIGHCTIETEMPGEECLHREC